MSTEKGTKLSSDKPDALDKTAQQSSSPIQLVASDNVDLGRMTYTKDEEKAVLKKIDCVILPMMCMVFFFQYMDKQSLGYASVFGLIDDLNLKGTQYSWTSSIFYIGQLVSEYPFIYLMSKLPLAKFVGVTIIIWGGICMCLSAAQNYAGFAAVRFLLGFSEGAVSPAFVSITSIWYRKREHPMRIGMWVTMNGLAQVIGSLLMYGIGKNSTLSLAPWRVLFIICGALTSFCGILFYILIPNVPEKAWFLNEREREVLLLRMAEDREGGDKTHFSINQLKETLTDAKAWLVFWFGVLVTMQSPVLTFASLVINNIGYDKFETMLYTSPSGAVQIVFIWIGVLGCFLMPNKRSLVVILLIIPPFIGNILLLKLPISAGWGLIVASWLSSIISDIMSILLSLSASNVKGNTKRAIVNTFFFIGYCAGCIGGPQLWTKKPRYFEGVVTGIVTWILLLITTAAYWYICARDNKLRDIAEQETTHTPTVEKGQDITDKEDPSFRYSC